MNERKWHLQPDMLTSIAATLISLCALATTYWQTKINRGWQQASVWPRLTFGVSTSSHDADKTGFYQLSLKNVGIGPALVRKTSIRYRGQDLAGDPRLATFFHKAVEDAGGVDSARGIQTSQRDLPPGTVFGADKGTVLLEVKGDLGYRAAIEKALPHLEIVVQYASVYGETWEVTYPRTGHRFVGWNEPEIH